MTDVSFTASSKSGYGWRVMWRSWGMFWFLSFVSSAWRSDSWKSADVWEAADCSFPSLWTALKSMANCRDDFFLTILWGETTHTKRLKRWWSWLSSQALLQRREDFPSCGSTSTPRSARAILRSCWGKQRPVVHRQTFVPGVPSCPFCQDRRWTIVSIDQSKLTFNEGTPGTNLFACGQLAAVSPMPRNFCYPACCPSVQCVHGVLAAGLSKFQKQADLKENLSSKRDTASIESEMRWKKSYLPLLWSYEGIGTPGMISTDLFRFVFRTWLKYCLAFRYT